MSFDVNSMIDLVDEWEAPVLNPIELLRSGRITRLEAVVRLVNDYPDLDWSGAVELIDKFGYL